MRCNNCGWDNEPGAATCAKCGSPIQNSSRYGGSPYAGGQVVNGSTPDNALKATVVSSPGMADMSQAPAATVVSGGGWAGGGDLRATVMDAAAMSNVSDITEQEMRKTRYIGDGDPKPMPATQPEPSVLGKEQTDTVQCENCHAELPPNFTFCPMCGARLPEKTRGPLCTLTLIPDDGEQIDSETIEYEGRNIVLNRANTEKTNHTITSREQAVLINENGRWYIENHSEMCSTYFEVNRRLELQRGDIIMLGDRRFRFEAE